MSMAVLIISDWNIEWWIVLVLAALFVIAVCRAIGSGIRGFIAGLRGDLDKKYYVDLGGETTGPYTLGQVATLYREHVVSEATLFATEGAKEWKPVAALLPKIAERTLAK